MKVNKLSGNLAVFLALLLALAPFIPLAKALDADWVDQPGGHLMATTEDVERAIGDPNYVIVDVRSPSAFEKEHIPGAVNLPYREIRDVTATLFKKPDGTINVEKYEKLFGEVGISNDKHVIIYGNKGAYHITVAYWILRTMGHDKVSVYNGGIETWKAAGKPTESGPVTPKAEVFKADWEEGKKYYVSTSYVVEIATNAKQGKVTENGKYILDNEGRKVIILDVRTLKEYYGQDIRTLRGGTIYGSKLFPLFVFWEGSEDPNKRKPGELKSPSAILNILEEYSGYTLDDLKAADLIIVWCQTGTRSTYTFWVLQMLGLDNVANYDDSWRVYGSITEYPAQYESWYNFAKLNRDIKGLKSSVDKTSGEISELRDQIGGVNQQLSELRGAVDGLSAKIDEEIGGVKGAISGANSMATGALVLAIIALLVSIYAAARKR